MEGNEQWESVYQTKLAAELIWWEAHRKRSLDIIRGAAFISRGRVIDIGGGYSIVRTFATGGPKTFSGLQICQYDAATMQDAVRHSFIAAEASMSHSERHFRLLG